MPRRMSASAAASPPMPPPTIAIAFLLIPSRSLVPLPLVGREKLQIEEREDLADQFALFREFLGRLIAAERAAGDVDLALLADDDEQRLFVVARLRPVQDELVIDQARLDAARFQRLRRLDVLFEELGQKLAGKLMPLAAILILLRALAGEFAKDLVQFRHFTLSCPAKAGHPVSAFGHYIAL